MWRQSRKTFIAICKLAAITIKSLFPTVSRSYGYPRGHPGVTQVSEKVQVLAVQVPYTWSGKFLGLPKSAAKVTRFRANIDRSKGVSLQFLH